MSFVPEENTSAPSINLAPMIDFLFLMLAFFASLAASRNSLQETRVDIVSVERENKSSQESKDVESIVQIIINKNNALSWVTEIKDYPMASANAIQKELERQVAVKTLRAGKHTKVLLKIDKEANWEAILEVIFAIRKAGFESYPLYEEKIYE